MGSCVDGRSRHTEKDVAKEEDEEDAALAHGTDDEDFQVNLLSERPNPGSKRRSPDGSCHLL